MIKPRTGISANRIEKMIEFDGQKHLFGGFLANLIPELIQYICFFLPHRQKFHAGHLNSRWWRILSSSAFFWRITYQEQVNFGKKVTTKNKTQESPIYWKKMIIDALRGPEFENIKTLNLKKFVKLSKSKKIVHHSKEHYSSVIVNTTKTFYSGKHVVGFRVGVSPPTKIVEKMFKAKMKDLRNEYLSKLCFFSIGSNQTVNIQGGHHFCTHRAKLDRGAILWMVADVSKGSVSVYHENSKLVEISDLYEEDGSWYQILRESTKRQRSKLRSQFDMVEHRKKFVRMYNIQKGKRNGMAFCISVFRKAKVKMEGYRNISFENEEEMIDQLHKKFCVKRKNKKR